MFFRDELRKRGIKIADASDPHYRGGWINMPCPFCGSEKNHLGVSEDLRRANCYKCGSKHPAQVLSRVLRWTRQEIDKYQAERYGDAATWKQPDIQFGQYTPPKNLIDLSAKDRQYLRSRGWDDAKIDQSIELYGLQSIGPFSGLPAGIFIPISDAKGTPVSWTVRFRESGPDGRRYHTASNLEKADSEKHLLFGENLLIKAGCNSIIVNEGPFDAMSVGVGAVCVFGLAYSLHQLHRISRYPRRTICFDNSPQAQKIAYRLCQDLAVFPGYTEQVCLDAADPGSASQEEIEQLRMQAGV
jgi:hypothetical protein